MNVRLMKMRKISPSRRVDLIDSVTPPEALNERGCGGDLSIEVLLALLLLHFQSEARAEDALK